MKPLLAQILILLAVVSSTVADPASGKEWRFRAMLDGRDIGEHTFTVREDLAGKSLQSSAKFAVKLLFITAYRYAHTATEHWNGNCLKELSSETVENSERTSVSGSVRDGLFRIKKQSGELPLNDCPMTFAYWNPEILSQQKLLNPQTGEWLPVEVKLIGREPLSIRGVSKETERYRIIGPKTEIDLWYLIDARSGTKEWVALRSITPDGYTVSYELI